MPTVRVTYEITLPEDAEITALVQRLQAQGPVFGETLLRQLIREGIIQWRLLDGQETVLYQTKPPALVELEAWVREWMAVRQDDLAEYPWIAMDQSGDVAAFEKHPLPGGTFWVQGGNVKHLGRFLAHPTVDWKTMWFYLGG